MKGIHHIALCLAVAIATSMTQSMAQGNLGDEQIDVVKAYQPMLSDAYKISDTPSRDTTSSVVPELNYEFTKVKFPTVYTITPIKAVKVKDDNIKKLYHGFIKGGYGTKNTPYAEITYNSLRSKDFDAGVHLKHLSSSGKIKDLGYPGMSETGISLFGNKFFTSTVLGGSIDYSRDIYHYYGYDEPPTIFSKSETKHSFNDFNGSVNIKSSKSGKSDPNYDAALSFGSFSDNQSVSETGIRLKGGFMTPLGDYRGGAELDLDAMKYKTDSLGSNGRSIVKVNPRIMRDFGRIKLTAGFNLPVEINEKTRYYFFPHLRMDMNVADEAMTAFAQFTGGLERTSFRGLSNENPFVGSETGPVLLNKQNTMDVSAGVNIKIENQLAVIGSFSYTKSKNDAFFYNYEATQYAEDLTPLGNITQYDLFYDESSVLNLHAELVYDQTEKAGIGISADYYSYQTDSLEKALYRPGFVIRAKGHYIIADKIYAKASVSYFDQRYFIDPSSSSYKTLSGYIDLNLGVDYRATKLLSVFVDINNATASKYERWYHYRSYGLGVMAGFSYSF